MSAGEYSTSRGPKKGRGDRVRPVGHSAGGPGGGPHTTPGAGWPGCFSAWVASLSFLTHPGFVTAGGSQARKSERGRRAVVRCQLGRRKGGRWAREEVEKGPDALQH